MREIESVKDIINQGESERERESMKDRVSRGESESDRVCEG